MHGFYLQKSGQLVVILMMIFPLYPQAGQHDAEYVEKTGNAATGAPTPSAEDRALVEEVIVIGMRPIISIRQEIRNTEDLIFDTFNELNEEDAFDIICTNEAPIGSQIRRRVCRSRYMIESESNAYVDFLDTGWGDVSLSRQRLVIKHQSEIMNELARENPQFLQLLKKRWALKQVYQERVKACGWNLKCLN
jgi:hypothetical protein